MFKVIYDGRTRHNRYRVVDRIYNDRPSRLLLAGDKASPQSGLALDDNPELLFDYNQRLFEAALSLEPRSVLVIGGGAFTLPRALLRQLPEAQIDAVEIDAQLPRLARRYFDLKTDRRLKIITADGRDYIDRSKRSYDLIIVDAFSEYDIPTSLLTVEAAAQYARLLSPNGTIALNIIASYRGVSPTLTHRLVASFGSYFQSIDIYPADPSDDQDHEQNLIFVASHQAAPSLDYLLSVPVYPSKLSLSGLELRD